MSFKLGQYVSEAKFEDFEYFGRISKEGFHSDSIRSHSGDEWQILEMYKSVNDADLHTQSIAMHITGLCLPGLLQGNCSFGSRQHIWGNV
jgi:hypothetical protein